MFNAVLIMGGLGLFVGAGLALASKIFYVYVNPKVAAIDDILPGANCGGCGMPGCAANAEAIVSGQAGADSCVAAGDDVTEAIAFVMGVSIEAKEPELALSECHYGSDKADIKFLYNGLNDCRAATLLHGGMKVCNIGCLGLGTCVLHCPFGAIHIGSNGLPIVDNLLCTGCGTCERVCPKNIIKLTSVTLRILKEYTTNDCTTPCQRSCPAGIDIREYIRLISQGDYSGAIQVIKERNPFPTVIGRICPRPCENDCRRKYVDEPVAINNLKRFAADYEKKIGKHILPFKAPATRRKIAIVGGGVHGLSAAFFAARLGHEPTVFETTNKLGGLLNTAISKYRLPKEILNWDIEGISKIGVNFNMGKKVGFDITISDLLENNFEAVFIASGGWDSRLTQDNYRDFKSPIPGIALLIDFLNEENLETVKVDEILCVGGGVLIKKFIKKCIEFNIKKINFIPRFGEELNTSLFKNLESNIELKVIKNMALTRFIGLDNNLTNVELTDTKSGIVKTLEAKMVVFSSGRLPEMIFSKPKNKNLYSEEYLDYEPGSWVGFSGNKHPNFSKELGILSKSDMVSDFDSAIKAISAGRRAAADIHKIMYNIPLSFPSNIVKIDSLIQNIDHADGVTETPRTVISTTNNHNLKNNFFDLEKALDSKVAEKEALRCLKCGLICYEHSNNCNVKVKTDINNNALN